MNASVILSNNNALFLADNFFKSSKVEMDRDGKAQILQAMWERL
jgi:hypothetical protein